MLSAEALFLRTLSRLCDDAARRLFSPSLPSNYAHTQTTKQDAESVAWLEKFLGQFRGTVVAVTHDRYFLDNVAGWVRGGREAGGGVMPER